MILKELLKLNEDAAKKSIKGWLAMGDAEDSLYGVEGVFVFKDEAAADKFEKGLSDELDGSDEYATLLKLDEYYIVFHCDHKVDEDDLAPIMFDVSKTNLVKRLKADVAAGAIYGIESYDQVKDDVTFLKTK